MDRLDVLCSDDWLLAVAKPSGLLVHRGWGREAETLVDLVREATGGGAVHPVHRLDRGTSGVVLFARDAATARALGETFERGEADKRYLALVRGVAPEEALVDHPIPRRPGGPRVPASTAVRRLASAETEPRHLSLVEARPRTGRLHQVRRHLKHIDHPVIGDASYGKGRLNRAIRGRYGLARLALHAARLTVRHPATGEELTLVAPLPDDLAGPLAEMGFRLGDLGIA